MINEEKKVEGQTVQLSTVKAVAVNEIERTKSPGRFGQKDEWGSEFEARVSIKVANLVQEIRLRWETDFSQQSDKTLISGHERPRKVVIKGDEGLVKNAEAFGILIDWSDLFNAYLILVNKWFDADEMAAKVARAKAFDSSWVQTMLPAFQAVKIEGVSVVISMTKDEFVNTKERYRGLGIKVTYGNQSMLIEKDNKGFSTDIDCKCYRASKPETFLKKLKEVVDGNLRHKTQEKELKDQQATRLKILQARFAPAEVKETWSKDYHNTFSLQLPGSYNFLKFRYWGPDKQDSIVREGFALDGQSDVSLTFDEFSAILNTFVGAALREVAEEKKSKAERLAESQVAQAVTESK